MTERMLMRVDIVKAEKSDSELHLSEDEVLAQVGICTCRKSTVITYFWFR